MIESLLDAADKKRYRHALGLVRGRERAFPRSCTSIIHIRLGRRRDQVHARMHCVESLRIPWPDIFYCLRRVVSRVNIVTVISTIAPRSLVKLHVAAAGGDA